MYDVIIIGGGPAGYTAALELANRKKKALLIEESEFGGVCLNEGCIPTKSILDSSKHGLSWDKINEKKNADVGRLRRGLLNQLKNEFVDLINSKASIVGKNETSFTVAAGGECYESKNLIIATGSSTKMLPIDGLEDSIKGGKVITNKGFLDNVASLPSNVVIIGGGVVGLEFATALARMGKKVTVLESLPSLMPNSIDDEIRSILIDSLERLGIDIKTNVLIDEIGETIVYELDGVINETDYDVAILAAGRTPNISDIGLDKIGIIVERGRIVTNDKCQTNINGVYACGDVNGKMMLAHVAYKEAEVAVRTIVGEEANVDYSSIPSVVFANPEIAFAGKSENECKKNGIGYYVKKLPMGFSSMYSILNPNQRGICKLLFNTKDEIIGAQLAGDGSSEMVFTLADMIARKETIDSIKNKVFPHPSIIEIIKETAKAK